ncbi:NAD(P)H-dependent oxidoreductase [Patescibacteria group bacterium]|nr:NAD(P)H-dependent oxidoreductase [Patescibacteria group bacterium]
MEEKVSLVLMLGTNRQDSESTKVAQFLLKELKKRDEIETTFLDLHDVSIPQDNYGQDLKEHLKEYKEAITQADGLIIVVPEYNHGYPGILKSVLDSLYPEYERKAAGLVGVSAGPWGGTRVIENLIPVLKMLGLVVTASDLQFPNVKNLFDEDGDIVGKQYNEHTEKFIDTVVWLSKTLKWGRENLD